MAQSHIHIIPIGFDIERLYLPITRGDLEADEAILMRTREDPALARNAFRQIERELESHDIEVRDQKIDAYDYLDLFAESYDLLEEHLVDTNSHVYLNVSSMPRTVAFGLSDASAMIAFEHPHLRHRIHTYYSAPEEYYAPHLVDMLEESDSVLAMIERQLTSSRTKNELHNLAQMHADVHGVSDQLDEGISLGMDRTFLENFQEEIRDTRDEESELEASEEFAATVSSLADPEFLQQVHTELEQHDLHIPEYENKLSRFKLFVQALLEANPETDTEFEPPLQHIQDAHDNLEEAFDELVYELDDIAEEVQLHKDEVQDMLRRVDRYGLSEGARDLAEGRRYVEFPVPTEPPERSMELAILAALNDQPEIESNTEVGHTISRLTAQVVQNNPGGVVEKLVESKRQRTDVRKSSQADFRKAVSREVRNRDYSRSMEESISDLLDELYETTRQTTLPNTDSDVEQTREEFIESLDTIVDDRESLAETFGSRVQYNLRILSQKGYVTRESRGRSTATMLNDIGELWLHTHDVEEILLESTGGLLRKPLASLFVDVAIEILEAQDSG